MSTWCTIIIFEYNDTQIIGISDNGHVRTSLIGSAIANFYTAVSAIAPLGSTITLADTYILTIYKDLSIEFSPNSNTIGNLSCSIGWPSIDTITLAAIDNLAVDIAIYL
jgi:hypothetical protein